ncbi:MAG: tetratricopeptide repeat protein [Planctomycetota bacterium]|nr:tetratricopeptide repeat protein [Planctomycetota bacterium]
MNIGRPTRLVASALPATFRLLACASFGVWIPHLPAQVRDTVKEDTVKETPSCKEQYEAAAKAYKGLPEVYRGMSTARADELARTVESTLSSVRRYLDSCAAAPRAAEMHFYQAKFRHLLSKRHYNETYREVQAGSTPVDQEELRRRMNDFYQTIARHARQAFRGLPTKSPLRAEALQLLGQAYGAAKDHEGARSAYEAFLKLYPEHEKVGSVTTALGRVYLSLELYDQGIDLVRKAQENEKIYASDSYPYLGEVLWKLHEAKGDVEGMLRSVEAVRKLYPMRLKSSTGLSRHQRDDYERYLMFSGFRRGYCHFATGSYDEARQGFHEHVDELTEKTRELQKRGADLPPYGQIYMKRSMDSIAVLDSLIDTPAPAEFNLAGVWVTDKKVTLEKHRGKVIAVVFRGSSDTRSATFLEKVDEFCAGEEDIELLSVCFLKGVQNVSRQLDELRDDLRSRGYRGSAGFDPDAANKSIFRAYRANVGSATFVAIDRQGNYVWFQQDPRTVDVNLARTILLRLKDGG